MNYFDFNIINCVKIKGLFISMFFVFCKEVFFVVECKLIVWKFFFFFFKFMVYLNVIEWIYVIIRLVYIKLLIWLLDCIKVIKSKILFYVIICY